MNKKLSILLTIVCCVVSVISYIAVGWMLNSALDDIIGKAGFLLIFALLFTILMFLPASNIGNGYLENGNACFIVGMIYETLSCLRQGDKDVYYIALVKDSNGKIWACQVSKDLPKKFTVSDNREILAINDEPTPTASGTPASFGTGATGFVCNDSLTG